MTVYLPSLVLILKSSKLTTKKTKKGNSKKPSALPTNVPREELVVKVLMRPPSPVLLPVKTAKQKGSEILIMSRLKIKIKTSHQQRVSEEVMIKTLQTTPTRTITTRMKTVPTKMPMEKTMTHLRTAINQQLEQHPFPNVVEPSSGEEEEVLNWHPGYLLESRLRNLLHWPQAKIH